MEFYLHFTNSFNSCNYSKNYQYLLSPQNYLPSLPSPLAMTLEGSSYSASLPLNQPKIAVNLEMGTGL